MDRYTASGIITAVTAAPGDTALALYGHTNTRPRLYHYKLSVYGTPVGDNILEWLIRRITTAGTGTAVTPAPVDVGGPAALCAVASDHTAEPTFGATIDDIGIHQRNTFSWTAAPGGELVIPASLVAGIGFTPIHASYASTAAVVIHFQE